MTSTCRTCSGPIVPPDTHRFCVACLGLAHAEAVLMEDLTCAHFADLPVCALRARREMARATAEIGPTAASEPLVGPSTPQDKEFDAVSFKRKPPPPAKSRTSSPSELPGKMTPCRSQGLRRTGRRVGPFRPREPCRPPGGAHQGPQQSCHRAGPHVEHSRRASEE